MSESLTRKIGKIKLYKFQNVPRRAQRVHQSSLLVWMWANFSHDFYHQESDKKKLTTLRTCFWVCVCVFKGRENLDVASDFSKGKSSVVIMFWYVSDFPPHRLSVCTTKLGKPRKTLVWHEIFHHTNKYIRPTLCYQYNTHTKSYKYIVLHIMKNPLLKI